MQLALPLPPGLTTSLSSTRTRRLLALLGVGLGFVSVVALAGVLVFWFSQGAWPGDTYTYYLAGERLNRGHELYDLVPSDFWYADRRYPLYSPPLIAVIWRPLAALPGYVGVLVWWLGMAYAALLALALLLLGTRGWAGVAILPLTPALGLLIGVGNVDALVLLGTIVAWRLVETGRLRSAGVLIGFLVSLKLTPAVLVVWLVSDRRWQGIRWTLISMALFGLVAMAGTEPGIFVRYLQVMRDGAANGHSWALVIGMVGAVAVLVMGRVGRSRSAFTTATILMPLASPASAIHSFSLLLGALAPSLDWEVGKRTAEAPHEERTLGESAATQQEPA